VLSGRSYSGWVPNVGSHLSFSMIGSGRGPSTTRFTGDHREPVGRTVCVLTERQTDDFLAFKWWKRLVAPAVVQDWLLVGETSPVAAPLKMEPSERNTAGKVTQAGFVHTALDDQGMLSGRVYVIPRDPDRAIREREGLTIGYIAQIMREARPKGRVALSQVVHSIENEVRWQLPMAVGIRFALMRTGEVRLWYDEAVPMLSEDNHYVVAKQAYFFIKDMVHHHVHHDPTDDQITPLVRFDTSGPESRKLDEEDWRRRTMWNISRMAEKQVHRDRLDTLRASLGVLAFADAFQKTLLPHIRDPNDASKFVPNESVYGYDFTNIRESTRVRVDQTASRRTATAPLLTAMVAGGLAVLALVSSLVSTRNAALRLAERDGAAVPATSGPLLSIGIPDHMLGWVAVHPLFAMGFVAAVLWTAFALFLNDVLLTPTYRVPQGIQATAISLARRLGLAARGAFVILHLLYGVILLVLTTGLFAVSQLVS
jgi:hypothetical protein